MSRTKQRCYRYVPRLCGIRDEYAQGQAEGIAKSKGCRELGPPSIDVAKVRDLKKDGLGASEIAKALKIGRASVYRALLSGL